jgi:hypothetical protein
MGKVGKIKVAGKEVRMTDFWGAPTWECEDESVEIFVNTVANQFKRSPFYFPDRRMAIFDYTVEQLDAEIIQRPDPIDYDKEPDGVYY